MRAGGAVSVLAVSQQHPAQGRTYQVLRMEQRPQVSRGHGHRPLNEAAIQIPAPLPPHWVILGD